MCISQRNICQRDVYCAIKMLCLNTYKWDTVQRLSALISYLVMVVIEVPARSAERQLYLHLQIQQAESAGEAY